MAFSFLVFLLATVSMVTATRHIHTVVPIGGLMDGGSPIPRATIERAAEIFSSPNHKLKISVHNVDPTNAFNMSSAMCEAAVNEASLVTLGTHDASTVDTVTSFVNTYHIPYVTSSSMSDLAHSKYVINLKPDVTKAIVDILTSHHWRHVVYLYESESGLHNGQKLLESMQEAGANIDITFHHARNVNDVISFLESVEPDQSNANTRVLLDISRQKTDQLLREMAFRPRNQTSKYSFFVRELELNGLSRNHVAFSGVLDITGMGIIDTSHPIHLRKEYRELAKHHRHLFPKNSPVQLEAALIVDAVQVISEAINLTVKSDPHFGTKLNRMLKTPGHADCFTKPSLHQITPREHVLSNLKKVHIRGMTGDIAFDTNGQRQTYVLSILQAGKGQTLKKVATWTPSKRLHTYKQSAKRGRRQSDKKTLIVTTHLTAPFAMLKRNSESLAGNSKYEGFCIDLIQKVCRILDVNCQIQPVKDGGYGARKPDGTWSGMIGELVRKEADMAVAPLTITSMRDRVVDFSKPFMSSGITILMKKPHRVSPSMFSFLQPFSTELWFVIIGLFLLISFTLYGVSRCTENPSEDHLLVAQGRATTELKNSFWYTLASLMLQSSEVMPRSVASRLIGAVWWMFCLIILCSYAANLSAFLTVERMVTPIKNAEDLSKQTEIKYGTIESSSTSNFFRTSKVGVYERMWAFMYSQPGVFVKSHQEGIEKVRRGRYAFLTESAFANYAASRQPCDLMKVGNNLDSKAYGIATPIGSEIRDQVSLAILQLQETGSLQKMMKRWWYDKGECTSVPKKDDEQKPRSHAMTLSTFTGLFLCVLVGLLLAVIVAVLTILLRALQQSRKEKEPYMQSLRSQQIWRRRPETPKTPEEAELQDQRA